jgi:uncharacterized CHY-type Zn-finger protein
MALPNLRAVRQAAAALKDKITVCCINCKKPLWELSNLHQYGTKTGAVKKSLCGYAWSDFWEKDNRTLKRSNCPFCQEPFLKAIQGPEGTLFPKMYILEQDSIW